MSAAPTAVDYLLALTPSVLFGFQTTLTGKVHSTDRQRVLGLVSGAFLAALVVTPFLDVQWNPRDMGIAFVTGLLLGWGLCLQLQSFNVLGVSRTMPLSTGGQLTLMALSGVLIFGEWRSGVALPIGSAAIILLIIGIWLLSRNETGSDGAQLNWRRGVYLLTASSIVLVAYVVVGRWFGIEGDALMFPQAVGYTVFCFAYFGWRAVSQGEREPLTLRDPNTYKLMLIGVLWFAAIMLLQVGSARVGVASGFTLTQLGILISTPLGIWWLGEKRTRRELVWTGWGVALVIGGAVLVGIARGIDAGAV